MDGDLAKWFSKHVGFLSDGNIGSKFTVDKSDDAGQLVSRKSEKDLLKPAKVAFCKFDQYDRSKKVGRIKYNVISFTERGMLMADRFPGGLTIVEACMTFFEQWCRNGPKFNALGFGASARAHPNLCMAGFEH